MTRWCFAVVLAAAGCGPPAFGPVAGTVTLRGRPLAGAEVAFIPNLAEGTAGRRATGTTDHAGRYELVTVTTDGRRVPGVVAGVHRVCVHDARHVAGDPASKSRVPAAYGSPETTPLKRVQVGPGGRAFDIDLSETP